MSGGASRYSTWKGKEPAQVTQSVDAETYNSVLRQCQSIRTELLASTEDAQQTLAEYSLQLGMSSGDDVKGMLKRHTDAMDVVISRLRTAALRIAGTATESMFTQSKTSVSKPTSAYGSSSSSPRPSNPPPALETYGLATNAPASPLPRRPPKPAPAPRHSAAGSMVSLTSSAVSSQSEQSDLGSHSSMASTSAATGVLESGIYDALIDDNPSPMLKVRPVGLHKSAGAGSTDVFGSVVEAAGSSQRTSSTTPTRAPRPAFVRTPSSATAPERGSTGKAGSGWPISSQTAGPASVAALSSVPNVPDVDVLSKLFEAALEHEFYRGSEKLSQLVLKGQTAVPDVAAGFSEAASATMSQFGEACTWATMTSNEEYLKALCDRLGASP